ncbi:MAG: biotin--[acetyl-CoA-carboxylase] ligase [Flavobacterium sp.]|nr:biotin--[acetyl-CoA-carboxylase] ligase [Pedobacter sp.]
MQNNIFLGLFVGHNTVTLNEVDSTNIYLKQLLSNSKPLPEGTVIMAGKQTNGRGQAQNSWQSEEGKNITLSILLNPKFLGVKNQFDLNIVVSLGLNDVLTNYFGDLALIKWPNDCYIGQYKIGGILIENLIQGNLLKHAIIGIGLNINQTIFPEELTNVTSFKKMLHTDYDLNRLKNEICSSIEARYLQLKAGKGKELFAAYLGKLYLFHKWADFIIDGSVKKGKICGVTSEGFLRVETEQELRTFGIKEIQFCKVTQS